MHQSPLPNLMGRLWNEAREELRSRGIDEAKAQVLVVDITPERTPRTPTQQFAWGELRVVRAHFEGEPATANVIVTVAREMKLAP